MATTEASQASGGLQAELKKLIIEALMLEDVGVDDIASGDPLFGEGLGLDSIDALEIAIALEERYGVQIGEDPATNQQLFASVDSLAAFVAQHRNR